MASNNIIVGMGEALWDMLPSGKEIGGAPANFAYHVSQFGLETCVVSALGNDELGDEIMQIFNANKLKTLIDKVDYPTGTVLVNIDEKGIPTYEIKEDVAWDNIPFTPKLEALALATKIVCFGSLAQRNSVSRDTINKFLDTMPDGEGQYKIFDINLRQHFYNKSVICSSLEQCNILKINDDEIEIVREMLGCMEMSIDNCCKHIIKEYKLEILILTCGVNGSYIFTQTEQSFITTPQVDVADTVGAGDSFTAAFISAMILGKTINAAHQLAVDLSAYVCTQRGAMPELPLALTKIITDTK